MISNYLIKISGKGASEKGESSNGMEPTGSKVAHINVYMTTLNSPVGRTCECLR
jgi:hypothetical protein